MRPQLKVEIMRAADAPWAPQVGGCTFRWAWRVRSESGDLITGLSPLRRTASASARESARRLSSMQQFGHTHERGALAYRHFKINGQDGNNG